MLRAKAETENQRLRDAIKYEIENIDYSSPEKCTGRLKQALEGGE
jgi:hypothetical protein